MRKWHGTLLVVAAVFGCAGDDDSKGVTKVPAGDASAEVPAAGGAAGVAGEGGTSGGGSGGTGGTSAGGAGAVAGAGGGGAGGGAGGPVEDASSAGGAAGSAAAAGAAGQGAAGQGGGAGAPSCSLGEACCVGDTCNDGYACLGDRCSCIKAIHGDHYLRTDGSVVRAGPDQVIEQGTTGQPLTGITAIYAGSAHGCGLRNDTTVWCWASSASGNDSGQLGRGTLGGTPTPWQAQPVLEQPVTDGGTPQPLSGVVAMNGGSSRCYAASSSCAVMSDSRLLCWGSHDSSGGGGGSLFNDGVAGAHPWPTPIRADATNPITSVTAVSLGTRHACLLRTGGEVWCWGANIGGPLGQGDETARTYPTMVSLPGPAAQVGAGADATCARVADGVYCWGSNNSGQIGIGTPASHSDGCINYCKLTPAQVVDASAVPLAGVVDLNVAYLAVCATRTDHSLWCWGGGTGVGDVAAPLSLSGNPVQNVAWHTSSSAAGITSALRYLTRNDELYFAASPLTQSCP